MYAGTIDIHGENVGPVLYASKRFQIKGLLNECIAFLDSSISEDNVCTILEQAHSYNESKLFDKCLKFILLNAADVLRTRAFLELCAECVKKVVSSDDLKADEVQVFESMVDWSTSECRRKGTSATDENRRQVLGNLLYQIRFPVMDVTYFTQRVSFRDILSDDEAVSVYQFFHGEERQLSRKFNKNERNRIRSDRNYNDRNYNQGNKVDPVPPMTTAQFVETRRTHRTTPTPTVRFKTPEPRNNSVVMDIPRVLNQSRVSRFIRSDGRWKQNGPPDAISFTCSSPIILYGVEVFGSVRDHESFNVRLYLFDDMKEEVCNGGALVTSDSFKRTCDVMFSRAVRVPPRRVFTVVISLKGSPCNKGIEGRRRADCDGVTFEFLDSNRSSNGTDVTVGQIPALIFSRTD